MKDLENFKGSFEKTARELNRLTKKFSKDAIKQAIHEYVFADSEISDEIINTASMFVNQACVEAWVDSRTVEVHPTVTHSGDDDVLAFNGYDAAYNDLASEFLTFEDDDQKAFIEQKSNEIVDAWPYDLVKVATDIREFARKNRKNMPELDDVVNI